MNSVLYNDIRDAAFDANIPWERLSGKTVLVTGATGLLGATLVRTLAWANAALGLDLSIIGQGRCEAKAQFLAQAGAQIVLGDIRDARLFEQTRGAIDAIVHLAAVTKSADMVATPADVISTMVDGTRNMLALARERSSFAFIYISSMEVYGLTSVREAREGDLGYLDLLSPRSSYPESKRLCETLCAAYFTQYGVPAKIARLAQTFGAGVSESETRVFAQFAKSALNGEDIVLHTLGNSRGNYCYLMDAIRGILTILLKGLPGEAYNVANPKASATIREMAGVAAKVLGDEKYRGINGSNCKVIVDIPADISSRGYARDTDFVMNADKLYALGWKPKYGLDAMFERMAEHWQERRLNAQA